MEINDKLAEIKNQPKESTTIFIDNSVQQQQQQYQQQASKSLNQSKTSLNQSREILTGSQIFELKQNKILPFELKSVVKFVLEITFLTLLFLCSSLWPSILSIVYIVFFLFLMTKWSLIMNLTSKDDKMQRIVKFFLIFYLALHILICYLYQFLIFQQFIQPDSLYGRLFGLSKIIYTKCTQPAHLYFADDFKWQQITYPFVLLLLYWFLTIEFTYNQIDLDDSNETSSTKQISNNNNKVISSSTQRINPDDQEEIEENKEVAEKRVNKILYITHKTLSIFT